MTDLPQAFNQAVQMARQGFQNVNAANAFKDWKRDLITRIVGQDED
jgi:hypothetical protein